MKNNRLTQSDWNDWECIETMRQKLYIVYLYCDYRKDVDIQFLKAFGPGQEQEQEAIEFAKQYSNDQEDQKIEKFVCIRGSVYDAELFHPGNEMEMTDETWDQRIKKYAMIKQELKIKPNMWYTRIAIDPIDMDC